MTGELRLVSPTADLQEEYLEALAEWHKCSEELSPWSLNMIADDFASMVERMNAYREGKKLPEGFVAQSIFWLVDVNLHILGAIDIRHSLTPFLEHRGGHIGYGIRPSERGKGYATEMLRLALVECRKLGMNKVLITCWKSNMASARVIISNGGVLESEDLDNGKIFQRYWISL
ncbi:MAG: GNAT family N-acetyltransferase [Fastidiosipila sp.]|nr:GNAT family N-acetyltransferase [Fastidiosipila sp.]